jgi:glycosyltransferase involved in cell wall biosynthesis
VTRRLTIVTPSLRPVGGTEFYVRHAIDAARQAGWTPRALVQLPTHEGQICEERHSTLLSNSMNPRVVIGRSQAIRHLADQLASTSDLVVFHRLVALDLLRALSGRTPTIVAAHTPELTCPAGTRFLRATERACEEPPGPRCLVVDQTERCLSRVDGARFPWQQRALALLHPGPSRLASEAATAMLFNSEATRADFERYVARPRRAFIVRPPLEVAPRGEATARDPDRVAFVGRLVEFKGAGDAVRALARLPARFHLDVYGDGPDLERVKAEARALGVDDRTTLHGWCERAEIQRALAASACLWVPTRGFEGFGQIGPQAIASGCPVVAYDVGGMGEWCAPPYGALVAEGDVEGLADGALTWSRRWGEGLDTSGWRDEAARRWGLERFGREYVDVLDEVSSLAEAAPTMTSRRISL